ncbi:MAG: FUSC family protein [Campylobacter sp.]|nr:FUSC family protein [Campylobacter sp.]
MTFFKNFINEYDPARFYLIYSLKATFAVSLNCFFCYFFLGLTSAIFAVNATMSIFFLSNLEASEKRKTEFILLYIALSVAFVPFIMPLINLGIWLAVLTFFWIFLVDISSLYSENLNKILLIVNGTGLSGLIVYNSSGLQLDMAIYGLLIGGISAIFIKFGTFSKYGSFTKNSINIVIGELSNLCSAMGGQDFDAVSQKTMSRIKELKEFFNSDSINLKDSHLIKNDSRAIFYLYKLEESAFLIGSLSNFFINLKDKELLLQVKSELQKNINELYNIFKDEELNFSYDVLNSLKQTKHIIFANTLSSIYTKFELMKDSNDDKVLLKRPKKISLKDAIAKISLSDANTHNALRLSLCMAIAIYIAQATSISHGIWIALAVMSLSRNNRFMFRSASKQNLLGGFLGFGVGYAILSIFSNEIILVLIAILGLFLLYYLKNYSLFAYSGILMAQLTLTFFIIKNDFLELILARLSDIVFGYGLVFAIYMISLPKSVFELESRIQNILSRLDKFMRNGANQENKFSIKQDDINTNLNEFKMMIEKEKTQKWANYHQILSQINLELINLNSYLISTKLNDDPMLYAEISLVASRFEMLSKKINKLPYYFLLDFKVNKIVKKSDKNLAKSLSIIVQKQNEIYLLASL